MSKDNFPDNVSVSSRSTLSSYTDTSSFSTSSGARTTPVSWANNRSDDSSVLSKKIITRTTTLGGEELVTVKKRRRKKKGTKSSALNYDPEEWNCIGYGELGIPELAEHLPKKDNKVLFGAMKIKVGTGKFQRCKTLFVHFNGINCPGLLRGKSNGKLGAVHKIIGDHHASFKCDERKEFTIDTVFDQVGHLFVTDNIQGSQSVFQSEWTLEDIKRQYQKQIEEKREEFLKKIEARPRKPIKKMSRVKEILGLVRSDFGWVNWCLFKPTEKKLKLAHEGAFGAGTIFSMRQNLADDQVYFGLLRMSFGVTPYRRCHIVMIHWVGPKVGPVKRGKLSSKAQYMSRMLLPYGVTIQLGHESEVTVQNIITRVRKTVVVDGHEDESPEIQDAHMMEEFQKALEEEEKKNAEVEHVLKVDKKEEEVLAMPNPRDMLKKREREIIEALHDVKVAEKSTDWILFEALPTKKKRFSRKRNKSVFCLPTENKRAGLRKAQTEHF